MPHHLQDSASPHNNNQTLPASVTTFLRRADALNGILKRISTYVDLQSIALNLVDDSGQLYPVASFGPIPQIHQGSQPISVITDVTTRGEWFFLPQGAILAGFKTADDELLNYNWHPKDILCLPAGPNDFPITAFLTVARPVGHRLTAKKLQILYGCSHWVSAKLENAQLENQLTQERDLRQRAEAALASQSRRATQFEYAPSPTNDEPSPEKADNQHIQSELMQRNRELLSLQSAVAATASSLDVPFVLETVTWEIVSLLKVENCKVLEWKPKDGTWGTIAEYGLENWWEQGVLSEDTIAIPLRERASVEKCAVQATINQKEINAADKDYMRQRKLKSLLILPMIFQDKLIGVVEISDSENERVFSDREISLTQLLANQAATTITNARLFHQTQIELVEREKAQKQISASLREKEILLKEIHHRVKNNLQVISSLLFLQSRFVKDAATLQALKESRARVLTMAMIHEKLYQSDNLAQINFLEYLKDLSRELVSGYNRGQTPVAFNFVGDTVFLDINVSVPCGLIVNELVSNALKHAFPADKTPTNGNTANEIRISLTQPSKEIILRISDNGVGMPPNVDLKKSNSLGMQLVTMLVQQIRGTLSIEHEHGTAFTLIFPAS